MNCISMVFNPILTIEAINYYKEASYNILKSRLLLVTLSPNQGILPRSFMLESSDSNENPNVSLSD